MNKKLIAIGIVLVFLMVGFSGCIDQEEQNDPSESIRLDFLTDCCISGGDIDPYNQSHLGIKEINWLDNSTVNIIAYVSLNCGFWIEGGGFNIYNNTITLNYYVGMNYSISERHGTEYEYYILANCNCASCLNFTIGNLDLNEYNFTLKKYEIKHFVENTIDIDSVIGYTLPDYFEIEYYNRTSLSSWHILKINSTGEVILEYYFKKLKEQKHYNLTNQELYEIYKEIIINNFFELNETNYSDNIIYDGNVLSLMVKADGKEHTVTNKYGHLEQIYNITEKIMKILDSKDGGPYE